MKHLKLKSIYRQSPQTVYDAIANNVMKIIIQGPLRGRSDTSWCYYYIILYYGNDLFKRVRFLCTS